VTAPPYDVIDERERAELAARSPFNVVEIDLPRGRQPYRHAAEVLAEWQRDGVLVREEQPALWALEQRFRAPDGSTRARRGFFARVRVEEYGEGRIRPHERTHPGPKEDRLRLTRATRAQLSPVFSLFPDPVGAAGEALERAIGAEPFARVGEDTLWRVADPDEIAALQGAVADAELLIADGHHRYETARVYADEVGGEGDHRYVLMFLCSLSDPGLTVHPTHRLLTGLKDDRSKQEAIRDVLTTSFEVEQVSPGELEPQSNGRVAFGYMDSFHRTPYRVTLTDERAVDRALPGKPPPYRRLDTAVLEALVLRGALGMSDDDIAHKRGLDYAKDAAAARAAVESGGADAAFFLAPTPVERVREVAEAGESMPPKSTYFFPKVPTGLVFNLLQ
jgi:uncharacterized protein (DUF1015 family)